MKKVKIILFTLCGVACLTGCSLFEKAESGDMDALKNALGGENAVTENAEQSDATEPDAIQTDVVGGTTDASTEQMVTATDIPIDNESLDTTTGNTTYKQGDTASISFKNGAMETAVIADITVDSIVRGEDAQYIIDMYNANNAENRINSNTNELLEFCVVNYTVDLKSAEGVPEVSTEVQCKVGGSDLSDKIVYNGNTYSSFPTLYNTNDYRISAGESGNGQIIFMLPVGCGSFSLTFGDPSIQPASFVYE